MSSQRCILEFEEKKKILNVADLSPSVAGSGCSWTSNSSVWLLLLLWQGVRLRLVIHLGGCAGVGVRLWGKTYSITAEKTSV